MNRIIATFIVLAAAGAPAASATDLAAHRSPAPRAARAGLQIFQVAPSPRAARRVPPAGFNTEDPADSLWRLARRAISDEDYSRAADLFAQIVDRYPKSEYAGNSLYWRAYALFQSGRPSDLREARAALERQQREYKDADSAEDARTLRTRVLTALAKRGDSGAAEELEKQGQRFKQESGCPSDDDDIRLAALQGLMQMDSESALPILREVLAKRDACSESLRKHAVFIVSQKRGDDATNLLLTVARTDPSIEVRGEAIQWLSQTHSERAVAALDSIAASATQDEILDKAIFALSQIRGDRAGQVLRRIAQDTRRSAHVRGQAIFWFGQSHRDPADLQFLRELFAKNEDEEIRNNVVQAMSQSRSPEGLRWLLDITRDKSVNTESRKNALFWAGQSGLELRPLIGLYDELRGEEEMQTQLVFVLSQRRESEATDKLMSIASNDPNREVRKQAIFWLGQKNDPRVRRFLLDLINR